MTKVLAALVEDCEPVAQALGCAGELRRVAALAASPGAARQRAIGLERVVEALSEQFLERVSTSAASR